MWTSPKNEVTFNLSTDAPILANETSSTDTSSSPKEGASRKNKLWEGRKQKPYILRSWREGQLKSKPDKNAYFGCGGQNITPFKTHAFFRHTADDASKTCVLKYRVSFSLKNYKHNETNQDFSRFSQDSEKIRCLWHRFEIYAKFGVS